MNHNFHLRVICDKNSEDLRKRTHTIEIVKNPALPKFKVQVPVSFKGPELKDLEKHCTPEHYYLAAIASCFSTTFSVIASNSDFTYNDLEVLTKSFIKNVSTGKSC
jgi:organic hydroperoxide reductase OsmC/OhrA